MFLISDNIDTYTGMRLAGVEGVVVHTHDELKDALQKAISNKEIGIILLTEKFGREFPEIIDDVKLHHKTPLIIEIPDRHGTGRTPDFITSYVNEAIGLILQAGVNMTIDEKLSHFYDITVEEAHEKAAAILDEHKAALEKMAEEHKTLSEENAQTQIKAETASARREINKALSAEQLTIKRDWTRKQNELKEKIFSEVKGLLESFTKTPEYENYLTAKIKEALDFAGNDEITIYLSPEDRSLAEKLQHTTGTAIQLAKDSFLGGIRATIPQKNILIDHSFAGNFEAAYKEFKFDGGPEHE